MIQGSKHCVLLMFATFAFSNIIVANDSTLEMDKSILLELSGAEEHSYRISLAEDQCAGITVNQLGIDVVVQLLGTDDKLIADFDFENTNHGEEKIEVVAETSGSYRLLIKAKYPKLPPGRYEIRWMETHNATEDDRLQYQANKLLTESTKLSDAGKYAEALLPAEKALELQERRSGAENPDLAYVLLNLASINYFKGEYAKGEAFNLRGLTITEEVLGAEHPLVASLLSSLALFYAVKGDARDASSYQLALTIREKALGPDHPLVASSLSRLGLSYRRKGDFVRAESLLQRALTLLERVLGEEDNSFASTLNNLAGLYREKGDYAKAEPLYQRSLAIYEKKNHPFISTALNNLANLYRDMGDNERAELLYQRSISIKEKSVGPDHPDLAGSRSSLASIYQARGDYARGESLQLSALKSLEKTNHFGVPSVLRSLANLYFETNDYVKAEPLYHRALSIFETINGANYYQLGEILVNLSKMSIAESNFEKAVAYQARANAIIEYNLDLNLAVGSERQKLAYMAKLSEQIDQAVSLHVGFTADDPASRELAVTTILQRKGRVQDALSDSLASLRNRFSKEDQALLDHLNSTTSQLAQVVLNSPQGASPTEHQKQIKTLEEQREKLESEISSRSAEFYVQSQPLTLTAIQAAILDDAALMEIAIYRPFDPKAKGSKQSSGDPRYAVYIIRRQGEVQWKDLGDAKAIDSAIDQWRAALRDPKRKDAQQRARNVDERIMQPIRPLLGNATQLLISPDGVLNLIPFEALVDEQNRYLIDRFSFTYLTSGRDLLRLQVARDSKSTTVVLANAMFGEPELIAMAKTDSPKSQRASLTAKRQSITTGSDLSDVYFAPLAGTAQEAQAIKSLFVEATVLSGTQATEASLKRVSAPRILHIATHGFFLTDAPVSPSNASGENTRAINASAKIENPLLRSGLALAGANLHESTADDGILTALEASGLNLWGTKLVTLSACDTGLGEVKNGEGVYGLRRAFVLAGTETLVMSLWPVSDYVTREMMTSYYKGLKQGLGRGEALRQVQLSMLKRKDRKHPFYWASFIQSGEWANLDGKR